MNLQSALEQEQQEAKRQQTEALNQRELYAFFRLHPALHTLANQSLLLEYVAELPVTIANLEAAATRLGEKLGEIKLAVGQERVQQDADAETQRIIEAKVAAENASITAKADQEKRWRGLGAQELRAEIKQMKAVEEITQAVDVPYSRKQLVSMSSAEMKRLLYTSNGEQRPGVESEVNRILAGD